MSAPLTRIVPPVGSSRRETQLPTVVLPLPDSPTRPSTSPGAIENDTPSTASHDAPVGVDAASDGEVLDEPDHVEHRLTPVRAHVVATGTSPGWKHATRWSGRTGRSSGTSDRLSSSARGHRSANAHDVGSSCSDGTRPGISCRRPFAPGARPRDRAEQADRVRVLRVREQLVDGRLLHLAARVHDEHAVGDVRDDAEVVRDQDDRRPEPLAQLAQQVEDARLDRHVEGGRRLVGDQDASGRRRAPSRSSRAAASRRRAGAGTRRPGAPGRGCARGRAARSPASARSARETSWCRRSDLADLLADREHRVERGHRLLEDERDLPAADSRDARGGRGEQVDALEARGAGDGGGRRAAGRRIDSAVTLLPQPDSPTIAEHLARRRASKRDAVDGVDGARRPCRSGPTGPRPRAAAASTLASSGRGRRGGRRRAG